MIFQKSLQNSLMCIERSTNRYENYKTINNVWFFMLRAILIGIVAKNFWIYICSWWKSIGPYQGIVLTTFLLKQMSRFCFRMWHILLMMKDVYKLSNWTCSSGKMFLYTRNSFLISCTAFKGLVLFAFYSYVNKPLGNKDR